MKLLLWGAIGFLVVMWLLRDRNAGHASAHRASERSAETEAMVRCAYCDLHVPASESVVAASGAVFCSEEHRRRHDA